MDKLAARTQAIMRNSPAVKSRETQFGERVIVDPSGCWAMNGELDKYHNFRDSLGRLSSAHRYAYQTLVGPIPEGHHLHHECENPGCVNPKHLVPLTPSEHANRHIEMRRECM